MHGRIDTSLGLPSVEAFSAEYQDRMHERLASPVPAREAQWTEALAVGEEAFVQQVAMTIRHRLRLEIVAEPSSDNGFVLRERADRYGGLEHVFYPKNRL